MLTPLRTLILEDTLPDAEVMLSELRKAGYDPDWCIVGTEPTYLAQLNPGLDVILSNYSLKQFDVLRALHILKNRDRDIPLIVVTGVMGDDTAVQCMKHGAADYLLKERIALLGGVVGNAIGRKHSYQGQNQAGPAPGHGLSFLDYLNDIPDLMLSVSRDGFFTNLKSIPNPSNAPANELTRGTLYELLPVEVAQSFMQRVEQTLQTGIVQTLEYQFDENGGTLDYEARFFARKESEVVVIVRDITEQKRMHKSLLEVNRGLEGKITQFEQTQAQLVQSQRLSALGQMASGVAHAINNALVPIMGFAELTLADPAILQDKERAKANLRHIKKSAQDMANIVNRLRAFYRPGQGSKKFEIADLNNLVMASVSHMQKNWEEEKQGNGIVVKTDFQEVPSIKVDEADLRELVSIMVLNAFEAMEDVGTIFVRTRSAGGNIVLEISDTGIGMSAEVSQRCLEPFFTTKAGGVGRGIGLAIAYGIVQRHAGTIEIESREGEGTTVVVNLPVCSGQSAYNGRSNGTLGRTLNVLVADDEQPVREVLSQYLTSDGHMVETTSNGRDALEKMRAGGIDLVVTDMGMPDMSGDQLAVSIKRIKAVPVIMLTALKEFIEVDKQKPSGVDIIVGKPVTLVDLRKAIAQAVGF